jgi:fructose-1-phosphate kinase PfkB-like protein
VSRREHGLGAAPDLVKLNIEELEAVLGHHVGRDTPMSSLAKLAERLRENRNGAVWLTLGARGSLLVGPAVSLHLSAPAGRIVNAVGCGDALAGGFAAGIARGLEPADAAALGVAAATHKLGRLHSGRVERTAVQRLVALVRSCPVSVGAVAGR